MNYLMMSKAELEVLRRRARRGWIALAIGGFMLVSSAFAVGYKTGQQRTYEQAAQAFDMLINEQKTLNAHIGRMRSETLTEQKLIINAAETIRQRDEIVRYNQENMCPDFQKAMANRKVHQTPSHE